MNTIPKFIFIQHFLIDSINVKDPINIKKTSINALNVIHDQEFNFRIASIKEKKINNKTF